MTRKGRDLEKLVALLEQNLGPQGIQITSPDYIRGKNSNSNREVDISLRSQFGSSDILVIFECRDRKGTEDVTWIEQLATKRKDVGANKAVAVSSTGFSSGAKNVAKLEDIELRTLEEVNPNDFLSWFGLKYISFLNKCVKFFDFNVVLSSSDVKPEVTSYLNKHFEIYSPIFQRKKDGKMVSFMDFWESFSFESIYFDITPNGSTVKRKFHLSHSDQQYCLQIPCKNGAVDIDCFVVETELSIKIEQKTLSNVHFYRDDDKIVAKTAEFEFEHMGDKHAFGLHQYPESGKQFISVRVKENDS